MSMQNSHSTLGGFKKLKYLPFYLLSLSPWWLLYFWSDVLFRILYYLIRYRRGVVSENLKKSFPEKNSDELKRIERDYYRNICDVLMEAFKALTIDADSVKRHFSILNPEVLETYFKENEHVVLYAAHQGNWEWLSFLPLFTDYHVMALYKPLSNTYFNELIVLIRERFGAKCVESAKGYREIVKTVKEKKASISIVIGDQCPCSKSSKVWATFLNQETAFLAGGGRIAEKLKQKVVYPEIKKINRGYYQVELKSVAVSAPMTHPAIIENYSQLLESSILNNPATWLWSHRRWKLARN